MPDRPLFWHMPAYLEAYRGMEGNWRATPSSFVRAGDWKLIQQFEDGTFELYNVKDDVGEARNQIDARPDVAAQLKQELHDWQDSVGAPDALRA